MKLASGLKVTWPALLLTLGAVAGLLSFLLLRDAAFPSASVDFKMDRGAALEEGRAFWAARAIELRDYWHTTTFTLDYSAKDYIDQKAGLETLNRLSRQDISVWQWRVRFFKPLQKEEFGVTFDINGRVVGFDHTLEEGAAGASLSQEEAQARAVAYLRDGQKLDMDGYTLVESRQESRPKRTDYTFTWERRDFKVADATYRLGVDMLGGEVGGYREWLKIPESWSTDQDRIWEHSNLLGSIGSSLNFFLLAALLIAFLLEVRNRSIRWRFALLVAAIVAVIVAAAGINDLPLQLADYDTKKSVSAYFLDTLIYGLVGVVGAAAYIAWQGTTGEVMSRRVWPERPSLTRLMSGDGLRSRPYVSAIVAGYALGLFQVGYVLAFYKVGRDHFGAWVPVGVQYSDILSTWLPWLYPMTVGAWAAVNEETFYRLFSISLLRRRLPPWLAALIPGVIWASLHAWYSMQPFYIRVLELSVVGFVLGLAFLRYGVLATIVAHYFYNASVSGPVIWEAGDWPSKVGLTFVLALPALTLLPAAWGRLRGRHLLRPEDFLPEPLPPPPLPAEPLPAPGCAPARRLSGRVLAVFAILAVLGLAFVLLLPPPKLGSFLDVALTREQAEGTARDKLRELGLSADGYRATTDFVTLTGGHAAAYLAQNLGVAKADLFLREQLPSYGWRVRLWLPEQEESFEVMVDPQRSALPWSGQTVRLEHTLREEDPAGRLDEAAARKLAEEVLFGRILAPADEVRPVSGESKEMPKRTDRTFTWEREDWRIGEGALRHYITVKGDTVGAYGSYFKVPESYSREREKKTVWRLLGEVGEGLLRATAIALVVVLFVFRFRKGRIDFRLAFTIGGIMAVVGLVGWLNGLPLFFSGYRHTESLESYVVRRIVGEPQAIALSFALWSVLGGLAPALYRQAFPDEMPLESQLAHWRERLRGRGWQVSLLALSAYPLYRGLLAIGGWARAWWLPTEAAQVTAPYDLLESALPALAALTDSLESAVSWGLGLALIASFLTIYVRRRKATLPVTLGIAFAWGSLGSSNVPAGLLNGGVALLLAGSGWLAVRAIRHDAATYAVALFSMFMVKHGLSLASFDSAWYAANGWAILGLGLLPVALCWLGGGLGRSRP